MIEDKIKWDKRYKEDFMPHNPCDLLISSSDFLVPLVMDFEGYFSVLAPSGGDIFSHSLELINPTKNIDTNYKYPPLKSNAPLALDIASGNGRHSKFLRSLGFRVIAIDISEIGLNNIKNIDGITTICADLDDFPSVFSGGYSFDLIINLFFLDTKILDLVPSLLKDKGIFIFESFVFDKTLDKEFDKKMLKENEIEEKFKDFNLIYKREYLIKESRFNRLLSLIVQKI